MLRISSTYLASGNFLCTFCKRWRRDGRKFQVMSFTRDLEQRYITSCQNTIKWTMTRFPHLETVKNSSSSADQMFHGSKPNREPMDKKAVNGKKGGRGKAISQLNYNVSLKNSERGDKKQIQSVKTDGSFALTGKRSPPKRTMGKIPKIGIDESLARRSQRLIHNSNVQRVKNIENLGKLVKTNRRSLDEKDQPTQRVKNGTVQEVKADKAGSAFAEFQNMLHKPVSVEVEQFLHEQSLKKRTVKEARKRKTLNAFKVSDPFVRQRLMKNSINMKVYDQTRLLEVEEPQCEFSEVQCGRKKFYVAFMENAEKSFLSVSLPEKLMKMPRSSLSRMTPEKIVKMIKERPGKATKLVKMMHDKPSTGGRDKPRKGGREKALKLKIPQKGSDFEVIVNLKKPHKEMSNSKLQLNGKTDEGQVWKTMKFQVRKIEKYWFPTEKGKIKVRHLTGALESIKKKIKLDVPKMLKLPMPMPEEGKVYFYGAGEPGKLSEIPPLDDKPKESIVKKLKLLDVKKEEKPKINKETERKYLFRVLRRKPRKVANEKERNPIEVELDNNVSKTFSRFDTMLQNMDKPHGEAKVEVPEDKRPREIEVELPQKERTLSEKKRKKVEVKIQEEKKPQKIRVELPLKEKNLEKELAMRNKVTDDFAMERIVPKPKMKTGHRAWQEIEKINREKQAQLSRIPPASPVDPYFTQTVQQKQKALEEKRNVEDELSAPRPAFQGSTLPAETQLSQWSQSGAAPQVQPSEESQWAATLQESQSPEVAQWSTPPAESVPQEQQLSASTKDNQWGLVTEHTQPMPEPEYLQENAQQSLEEESAKTDQTSAKGKESSPKTDFYYPEFRNERGKVKPPGAEDKNVSHFSSLSPERDFIPIQRDIPPIFMDKGIQMYELEETIRRPFLEHVNIKEPETVIREDLPESFINKEEDKNWDVRERWERKAHKVPNLRKMVRAGAGNADYVHSFIIESDTLGECYSACKDLPEFRPRTALEYNFKYDQEPEMRMFENVVAQNFTRVDDPDFIHVERASRSNFAEGKEKVIIIRSEEHANAETKTAVGEDTQQLMAGTGGFEMPFPQVDSVPVGSYVSREETSISQLPQNNNYDQFTTNSIFQEASATLVAPAVQYPESVPDQTAVTDTPQISETPMHIFQSESGVESKEPVFLSREEKERTEEPVTIAERDERPEIPENHVSDTGRATYEKGAVFQPYRTSGAEPNWKEDKKNKNVRADPLTVVASEEKRTKQLDEKFKDEIMQKLKEELSTKLKNEWKVKLFDELADKIKPVIELKLTQEKPKNQLYLEKAKTERAEMAREQPQVKDELKQELKELKEELKKIKMKDELKQELKTELKGELTSRSLADVSVLKFESANEGRRRTAEVPIMEIRESIGSGKDKDANETCNKNASPSGYQNVAETYSVEMSDWEGGKKPPEHLPRREHPYLPQWNNPPEKEGPSVLPQAPETQPNYKDHPYLPRWSPLPQREVPAQPYYPQPQTPTQPYHPQPQTPTQPYHPQPQTPAQPYQPQTQPPSQPYSPQTPNRPYHPQPQQPPQPYNPQPYQPQYSDQPHYDQPHPNQPSQPRNPGYRTYPPNQQSGNGEQNILWHHNTAEEGYKTEEDHGQNVHGIQVLPHETPVEFPEKEKTLPEDIIARGRQKFFKTFNPEVKMEDKSMKGKQEDQQQQPKKEDEKVINQQTRVKFFKSLIPERKPEEKSQNSKKKLFKTLLPDPKQQTNLMKGKEEGNKASTKAKTTKKDEGDKEIEKDGKSPGNIKLKELPPAKAEIKKTKENKTVEILVKSIETVAEQSKNPEMETKKQAEAPEQKKLIKQQQGVAAQKETQSKKQLDVAEQRELLKQQQEAAAKKDLEAKRLQEQADREAKEAIVTKRREEHERKLPGIAGYGTTIVERPKSAQKAATPAIPVPTNKKPEDSKEKRQKEEKKIKLPGPEGAMEKKSVPEETPKKEEKPVKQELSNIQKLKSFMDVTKATNILGNFEKKVPEGEGPPEKKSGDTKEKSSRVPEKKDLSGPDKSKIDDGKKGKVLSKADSEKTADDKPKAPESKSKTPELGTKKSSLFQWEKEVGEKASSAIKGTIDTKKADETKKEPVKVIKTEEPAKSPPKTVPQTEETPGKTPKMSMDENDEILIDRVKQYLNIYDPPEGGSGSNTPVMAATIYPDIEQYNSNDLYDFLAVGTQSKDFNLYLSPEEAEEILKYNQSSNTKHNVQMHSDVAYVPPDPNPGTNTQTPSKTENPSEQKKEIISAPSKAGNASPQDLKPESTQTVTKVDGANGQSKKMVEPPLQVTSVYPGHENPNSGKTVLPPVPKAGETPTPNSDVHVLKIILDKNGKSISEENIQLKSPESGREIKSFVESLRNVLSKSENDEKGKAKAPTGIRKDEMEGDKNKGSDLSKYVQLLTEAAKEGKNDVERDSNAVGKEFVSFVELLKKINFNPGSEETIKKTDQLPKNEMMKTGEGSKSEEPNLQSFLQALKEAIAKMEKKELDQVPPRTSGDVGGLFLNSKRHISLDRVDPKIKSDQGTRQKSSESQAGRGRVKEQSLALEKGANMEAVMEMKGRRRKQATQKKLKEDEEESEEDLRSTFQVDKIIVNIKPAGEEKAKKVVKKTGEVNEEPEEKMKKRAVSPRRRKFEEEVAKKRKGSQKKETAPDKQPEIKPVSKKMPELVEEMTTLQYGEPERKEIKEVKEVSPKPKRESFMGEKTLKEFTIREEPFDIEPVEGDDDQGGAKTLFPRRETSMENRVRAARLDKSPTKTGKAPRTILPDIITSDGKPKEEALECVPRSKTTRKSPSDPQRGKEYPKIDELRKAVKEETAEVEPIKFVQGRSDTKGSKSQKKNLSGGVMQKRDLQTLASVMLRSSEDKQNLANRSIEERPNGESVLDDELRHRIASGPFRKTEMPFAKRELSSIRDKTELKTVKVFQGPGADDEPGKLMRDVAKKANQVPCAVAVDPENQKLPPSDSFSGTGKKAKSKFWWQKIESGRK